MPIDNFGQLAESAANLVTTPNPVDIAAQQATTDTIGSRSQLSPQITIGQPTDPINLLLEEFKPKRPDTENSPFVASVKESFGTLQYAAAYKLYSEAFAEDGYSVWNDKLFTSKPVEWQVRNANAFTKSQSPAETFDILTRMDNHEANLKAMEGHMAVSLLGTLTGGLLDGTAFIPAGRIGQVGSGVRKVAEVSALGAAYGAATTGLQQSYTPGISDKEIFYNTLGGAIVGGVIQSGFTLGGAGIKGLRNWSKTTAEVSTGEKKLAGVVNEIDNPTGTGGSVGAAAVKEDLDKYSFVANNKVAKVLNSVGGTWSTNIDLQANRLGTAAKMSYEFGGNIQQSKANLANEVNPTSIPLEAQNRSRVNETIMRNNTEAVFAKYKQEGGILEEKEFFDEVWKTAGSDIKSDNTHINKIASDLRQYFDNSTTDLEGRGLIGNVQDYKQFKTEVNQVRNSIEGGLTTEQALKAVQDFIDNKPLPDNMRTPEFLSQLSKAAEFARSRKLTNLTEAQLNNPINTAARIKNYLPQYRDVDKIMKDPVGFANDVATTWAEGGAVTPELLRRAEKFTDDLLRNETSLGQGKNWQAKSLKERELHMPNELAQKWLLDDKYQIFNRYSKDIEMQRTLQDRGYMNTATGELNPYGAMKEKLDAEYEIKFAEAKDAKERVALKEDYDKAFNQITGLMDVALGNNNRGFSALSAAGNMRMLNGLSAMKLFNNLTYMSLNAITQLSDVGAAIVTCVFNKMKLNSYLEKSAQFFTHLSKEDLQVLGIAHDKFMATDRIAQITDTASDIGGNRTARFLRWANQKFFETVGVTKITQFSQHVVAEDGARFFVNMAKAMTEGKVSADDLVLLANEGMDLKTAKAFMKQIEKYGKEVEVNGQKMFDAHVDMWDYKDKIKFYNMLKQRVDRVVVVPSVGDKPRFLQTKLGEAVGQYKNFMLGAYAKQLLYGVNKINQGGGGEFAARVATMGMIGAAVGTTRDILAGRDVEYTPERLAFYAFDKGGFLPIFDWSSQLADTYGIGLGSALGVRQWHRGTNRPLGDALLGPTFSRLNSDIPALLGRVNDGNLSQSDIDFLMRFMPFNQLVTSAANLSKL